MREVGSLLLPVLACIGGLMATCFGLAVLLDLATSATLLDAYLATTPACRPELTRAVRAPAILG